MTTQANSEIGSMHALDAPPPVDSLERVEHARALLKEFSTVMLITQDRNLGSAGDHPKFHARPMAIAQVDTDCSLWFITSIDSSKVDEALTPYDGHAVAQTSTRQVSISGTFSVVRDPDQIKTVWKKEYEVWFRKGRPIRKFACSACIRASSNFGMRRAIKGLKYLFDSAKALITGEPPKPAEGQHDKVRLA